MGRIATVLHISDLHFVEEMQTEGRRLGWRGRTFFMKSHSFAKLRKLNRTLFDLEKIGRKYDLVLATGDLTTDGSEGAFRTALEFIEQPEISRGEPSRVIAYGLGVSPESRIMLPGNHDRYGGKPFPFQRRNKVFETILKTPRAYPYSVGYRGPQAKANNQQWTLLFFVFDSTPTRAELIRPWRSVARGEITDAECEWLLRETRQIVAEKHVPSLGGGLLEVDPKRTIRIAVLHHHPVVEEGKTDKGGEELMSMDNDGLFRSACVNAGINLVLFGHQHVQYQHT